MKICYLVNNTEILVGGNKVIFEHVNGLLKMGHEVFIVSHGKQPKWHRLNAKIITVPKDKPISDYVPKSDIIICTYYTNALETIKAAKKWNALPFYFFQGNNHIFNYSRFDFSSADQEKALVYNAFKLPFYQIICLSKHSQQILFNKFNVKSIIIPNSIDKNIFKYKNKSRNKKIRIIILGTDHILAKGITDIYEALNIVKEKGYQFKMIRVSGYKQFLYYLETKFYISPTQKKIAELLNSSDILISASHCEAWGLPPFEAMACGTAVITSDNGGVKEYAVDRYNCLMFERGNVKQLAEKIIELINNEDLRDKLKKNGLETIKKFNWKNIIDNLEGIFANALMSNKEDYLKKVNSFALPKESPTIKEEKNRLKGIYKEEIIIHLFEKNKTFLEAQIRKNKENHFFCYCLAQLYLNTASFLLQENGIDVRIRGMLEKAIRICKPQLLKEGKFSQNLEDISDNAKVLLFFEHNRILMLK